MAYKLALRLQILLLTPKMKITFEHRPMPSLLIRSNSHDVITRKGESHIEQLQNTPRCPRIIISECEMPVCKESRRTLESGAKKLFYLPIIYAGGKPLALFIIEPPAVIAPDKGPFQPGEVAANDEGE